MRGEIRSDGWYEDGRRTTPEEAASTDVLCNGKPVPRG